MNKSIKKTIIFVFQESISVIKNLQIEIEERNKKILRLELSQKAQIVTQNEKKHKPRMEITSLIEPTISSSTSSGPTYDNVATGSLSQDQINVVGVYAQKNKLLNAEIKVLKEELGTAKGMLKSVEKYWSQQVRYFISKSHLHYRFFQGMTDRRSFDRDREMIGDLYLKK